jgi:hypothetical protein
MHGGLRASLGERHEAAASATREDERDRRRYQGPDICWLTHPHNTPSRDLCHVVSSSCSRLRRLKREHPKIFRSAAPTYSKILAKLCHLAIAHLSLPSSKTTEPE